MIWFKDKLEGNLSYAIKKDYYKKYRVLIYCSKFLNNIEKKITSYKGTVIYTLKHCSAICALLTPKNILQLIEFPEVKWVTRDSYCFLCASGVESSNRARLPEKSPFTGRGIGVAVIDTGAYPHSDLITPFNRIRLFTDLINNYRYPYDDNGHGTFISGIIAGNGSLSKGIYKGIAPGAQLYCYKAFNSLGKAYTSTVLFALEEILDAPKEYNIRIICLPFELYNNDHLTLECFSKLFNAAIERDMVPIVPSGSNYNSEGSIEGFACLQNCITVGGLDTSSSIKSYFASSGGPFQKNTKPDLAAACVDICSLNTNKKYISERNGNKLYPGTLENPYCNYSGASVAAAYISGLTALILENRSKLKFKDVKALLKTASNSVVDIPRYQQGEGMVDITKLFL